jgi:hypothetical protein
LGKFVCLNSTKVIVNARDVPDDDRSLLYPSMVVSTIDQIRTIVVMSTALEFDLVRLTDGGDVKNTAADGRWCWVLAKGVQCHRWRCNTLAASLTWETTLCPLGHGWAASMVLGPS